MGDLRHNQAIIDAGAYNAANIVMTGHEPEVLPQDRLNILRPDRVQLRLSVVPPLRAV